MNNVTPAYMPYAPERRIGARMSFALIDVDATGDNLSVVPSTAGIFFSQSEQLIDGIMSFSQKIATIEPDGWILDGSYGFVNAPGEGDNGQVGWWSRVRSGADGSFPARNFVVYVAGNPVAFSAVTVVFDELAGVWATDFRVTAWDSSDQRVGHVEISGNSEPIAVVTIPASDVRSVMIRVTKLNKPDKYLRICEIVLGEIKVFGGDSLTGVTCRYGGSVYGEALPAAEAQITVDNSEKKYNIVNPVGIYRYLQQGQALSVLYTINGQMVNMGRFYFAGVESSDNAMTATITAYDRAWLLDNTLFQGGRSGTWTIGEAIAEIIAASGLSIATNIPASVAAQTIYRCVPQDTTCREALRLVAQAGRCVCFFSRLDVLTLIEPGLNTPVDALNYDRMAAYPTITDTGLINYVELTVRNDYTGTESAYIAENVQMGEPRQTLSVANPLVTQGQAVADWILAMQAYRITYDCNERGNPAREIEDTITILDAYGEKRNARTLDQEFTVGGGLSGVIKAVTNYV